VNPTGEWREGVYVFPLPENAAVDHLDMRIGERVVEGQIRERDEARRSYETAKAEGRKTALVEQERPNLFTTSVAHIGPGEEVVVAIEYQQTLAYDGGSFALRFPLAITPRYVPGAPAGGAGEGDGGGVARSALRVPADEVTDADRIAPPVADPAAGAINPVAIGIELNAGFPLAHLASRHHAVHIEERPGHRYALALAQGVVPAARDFELTWTPDVGAAPGAALLTEQRDGRRFALLMVLPPAVDPTSLRPPREITYIVDTSGSMEGVSIEQAKEALLLALDRLRPGDRFNVIEFNSTTRSLHGAPIPVDVHTVAAARAFVRGLRARGGTEMLPALTAALATPRGGPHLRQIVFLTDGAVGNEDQLLRLIEQRLDGRRLFTIGIGPAPNAFFMKKAAEAGRGTFTFIGDAREVKERMGALLRKIESPVLTDLDVRWPGAVVAYPGRARDLYAGEPVVLTAELAPGVRGDVMLAGQREGRPWQVMLPLDASAREPGVGVLWARDRIEALLDAKRSGAPAEEVRREVVATALAFHLVSAHTSLVAVDVTPTKPAGVEAIRTALPVNLPEGLTFGAIGGVPQTATPAPLLMLAGMVALLLALVLHLARRRADRGPSPATDSRAVAAARCVC
jgi:Ca-activated chloride channel family protein